MIGYRLWLGLWCLLVLGCAGAQAPGVGLRQEAIALNDTGYQYYRQGKWDLAKGKFSQALKNNRLIDYRPGIAINLNNLGAIAQEQGELDQAADYFQEALALYRETGEAAGICETLNNLGTVRQAQGRLDAALEAYREAQSWAGMLTPGPLAALTLSHLGDVARSRGDYAAALDLYTQALQLDLARKDRRGQAVRWERLGRTQLELQNYGAAAKYLDDALREFRRLEDTDGIVDSLKGLTHLSLAQGDRPTARGYGERLFKIYQARGQEAEAKKLEALLGK